MSDTSPSRKGIWQALSSPSQRYSLLALIGAGFIPGMLFLGGFNIGMDATNTMEFCISCHEMQSNYQEYKKTIHYTNLAGVRATCADCHVPKDEPHKILRKIQAAKDIWGTLTGSIDTKEKFEAKRLEMAKHEWERMKASDSQECRNCHQYEAMNLGIQDKSAKKKHEQASLAGSEKTCIDCHQGIAHNLPEIIE